MLPVIVPIVQENELGMLEVKLIFDVLPLHILAVDELVTAGLGLTVTVIGVIGPTHVPVVDVGVTL